MQPVDQVTARCGEHAVLREVDVCIDQSGQHQGLPVIVRRQRAEPLRQAAGRPAPRNASPGGDGDGAAAVEPHRSLRADAGGIVAVGEHRAAHYPSAARPAHDATRSSRRKRRMRSTLASASARSVAGAWSTRVANAARIASLVAPLTAKMNGKPKRSR